MKIKKEKLNEETINDRVNSVASKLDDSDVVDYEDYDELVDTLDAALKSAKRELRAYEKTGKQPATFNNVLVTGLAGTGKTGRITAWAQSRGVNLVTKIANTVSPEALGGIYRPDDERGRAVNLPTSEFDSLDAPNSVLFLDEFNRARPDQTGVFLKLMNEHLIPDGTQSGGLRFLPNLLFCVAAINPDDGDYQVGKLDPAALTRTYGIYLPTDPKKTLEYLSKRFDDQIKFAEEDGDEEEALVATRRKALLTKLLTDPTFRFDTQEEAAAASEIGERALQARTLELLLNMLTTGTKSELLRKWNNQCNPAKLKMVKAILTNYEDPDISGYSDVDDKANDVLKQGTTSSVFAKHEPSNSEKLRQALGK